MDTIAKEFEERLLRIGKDAIGKVLEVYKRKTRKGAERDRLLDMEGIIQTLECLLKERLPTRKPKPQTVSEVKRTVRDKCNEAAHDLAKAQHWKVPADLNFEDSGNPRGNQIWGAVLVVYESFYGDRPDLDAEIEEES